eukprot:Hpha_TRINITY_DN5599_c0_g1::TRINITY_DN5599_c0_g1_i1::g.93861::m.93861
MHTSAYPPHPPRGGGEGGGEGFICGTRCYLETGAGYDVLGVALVGRVAEDIGDLHVGRTSAHVQHLVCNVVGNQGRDTRVHLARLLSVPIEPYERELCLHHSRTNRSNPHGRRDQVVPGGDGESVQCEFRRVVRRPPLVGLVARDGGDVDNVATPPLHHTRGKCAHENDGGEDVGLQHRPHLRGVVLVHRRGAQRQPRVVHQNVNGSNLLRKLEDLVGVPHVDHFNIHPGTGVLLLDLLLQLCEPFLPAGTQHQRTPQLCEAPRNSLADACARTRDKDTLAANISSGVQGRHFVSLPVI